MRCETCGFMPCRCEDLKAVYRPLSDGRRVHVAGVTGNAGWPMKSDAFGVVPLPGAIKEAYEESVRQGVPTDYDREGFAILTDENHKRRLGKAQKLSNSTRLASFLQPIFMRELADSQ